MHLSISAVLLVFVVALIGALTGWLIYILLHKQRYTRERFAFVGFASFCALASTVIGALAHKATPWGAVINLVREIAGLPILPDSPKLTENILMVIVLGIVGKFFFGIHNRWSGAISVKHFERKKYHEPSPIYFEALAEVKRIIKREPEQIYTQEESQRFGSVLESNTESLAWHIQARDLISLRNPSYEIDRINGWHEEFRCWTGFNKKTRQLIAIRCDSKESTQDQLEDFVSYVLRIAQQKQIASSSIELFWAVKNSNTVKPTKIREHTLRKETEETLLNELVDFSDYFEDIKDRVERHNLPDSALNITEVYTPCSCRTENGTVHSNLEKYIKDWLLEKGGRQIALLGEYGQGKSTTALMTTYHLIQENFVDQRIPILIELRGKSPRNMTPEEIIAAWAVRYRISPQAVFKLLMAGRALLILEGFDEMALIGDSEARLAHFRTLWKFCTPLAKIIITGRPNFFLDDQEMKAALGISKSLAAGPYCEAAHLEPFTITQIDDALRSVPQQTRHEIVSLAKADTKFREIVSRGSLLYVVSQLWERAQLSKYAGHITSAFVMDLFIQHSYRRQSAKTINSPEFMVLDEAERKYFMSGIAAYMGALDLPNQIDREQFMRAIKDLYDVIPDSVTRHDGMIPFRFNKSLKERLRDLEDPLQDVGNDVRSSGILVADQSKSGALKFAHKSFMEFLIAEVYADHITKKKREISSAIVAASRLRIPHLIKHEESMLFFAELFLGALDPKMSKASLAAQLFELIVVQPSGGWLFGRVKAVLGIQSLAVRSRTLSERVGVKGFIAAFAAPEIAIVIVLTILAIVLDKVLLVHVSQLARQGFFISTVRLRDWVQTVSSSHTIS